MHQSPNVAVIGAGIAGIACAAALRDSGINVKVFDKSRGVGGRMATRRVSSWQWDHGMQYMTGEDPVFQRLLNELPTWNDASAQPWYVGQPSQSQLVKMLAKDIDLALQTKITNLDLDQAARWMVQADDPSSRMPYDGIAVAIPAPQARDLLPQTPPFADLGRVKMNPCWVLMVASPVLVDLPVTISSPHEHIAWFAADHSKPGRPAGFGQYVVHANAAWSQRHLECSNDVVKEALLDCFHEIVGDVEISYAAAHRWRYALTENPLDQPFLLDADNCIGVCGDWCLGARVEHGFRSGTALGGSLAAALTRPATA